MPESISVALITHATGAHIGSYLSALANTEQCSSVALVDRDGSWNDDAQRVLGEKPQRVASQTRLTRPSYQQQWFCQKARGGGGHLIWLGIHWLDLAIHLTGSTIQSVAGFTANVGGQPIDFEDSAAAALRFDNGMLGTITSGYYLDRGYHSHIKISGFKGWLHLEPMKAQPLTWSTTVGPDAGKLQIWEGSKSPRGYTPDRPVGGESLRRNDHPTRHRHRKPASPLDRLRDLRIGGDRRLAARRMIELKRPWVAHIRLGWHALRHEGRGKNFERYTDT